MNIHEKFMSLRVCDKIYIEHQSTQENITIELHSFHEGSALVHVTTESASTFSIKKVESRGV